MEEHDGLAPLARDLDGHGSLVYYLPELLAAPDALAAALEATKPNKHG